jgi:hypothetical protein
MAESFAILGAIKALTIPSVFDIELEVTTQLCNHQRSSAIDGRNDALAHWSVPATNISLACNHEASIVRAQGVAPMSYSILSTLGSYILSNFEVPDLKLHCRDTSGTVMVGMTGIFEHGLPRGDGNRITLSAYIPSTTLEETSNITKNDCSSLLLRSRPLLVSSYDQLVRRSRV